MIYTHTHTHAHTINCGAGLDGRNHCSGNAAAECFYRVFVCVCEYVPQMVRAAAVDFRPSMCASYLVVRCDGQRKTQPLATGTTAHTHTHTQMLSMCAHDFWSAERMRATRSAFLASRRRRRRHQVIVGRVRMICKRGCVCVCECGAFLRERCAFGLVGAPKKIRVLSCPQNMHRSSRPHTTTTSTRCSARSRNVVDIVVCALRSSANIGFIDPARANTHTHSTQPRVERRHKHTAY